MPYFAQEENQCGPASLAMLLGHRDSNLTPDDLTPRLFIPKKAGTLAIELLAQARQEGFLAYSLAADIEDIFIEIDAGNPVLVMQNLGFSWYPRWHFAVAYGYDLTEEQIILRSGPNEIYAVPISLFEKTWERADYWAMVTLPPDELPASAKPLDMAVAANALEQTGKIWEARVAYQAMLNQWPDNSLALFGLGNIQFQQGQYAQALGTLTRRAQLYPDTAETWNNLAYVEQAMQCGTNATEAAQCAVALQPERTDFANTLKEITAVENSGTFCPNLPECPAESPEN